MTESALRVGKEATKSAKRSWISNEMIEGIEIRGKWKRFKADEERNEYHRQNNKLRRGHIE